MTETNPTLLGAAIRVLATAAPEEKVAAAQDASALLASGAQPGQFEAFVPPDRPARPARPALVSPAQTPRRRLGSREGRAALLHAIAHIEFNAIDLAFDMAARFGGAANALGLNASDFVADWIRVGTEEARHFSMISERLAALGSEYGAFPAHDGLWEAAMKTRHDLSARLVVAPLILEARGLDVTPGMIERLAAAGDEKSAAVLQIIYEEEIGHVACGKSWFHEICIGQKQDPTATFRTLRKIYFPGALKPPFNHKARDLAGLPRQFYEPF